MKYILDINSIKIKICEKNEDDWVLIDFIIKKELTIPSFIFYYEKSHKWSFL